MDQKFDLMLCEYDICSDKVSGVVTLIFSQFTSMFRFALQSLFVSAAVASEITTFEQWLEKFERNYESGKLYQKVMLVGCDQYRS